MTINNIEERPTDATISWNMGKSKIYAFLSFILFKIALDLSYYFLISQIWGYAGFMLQLNILKLIESYVLLGIIFIAMPKSSKRLSNILVWMLILLSYIPMLTLFAFGDEYRIYMYAVTGFWLLVFLLLRMPLPNIYLPPLKQSKITFYSISICLGVIVIFIIWRYFGLSFKFDLSGVYEIRAEHRLTSIPMAGYLFNWVARVINPILFALFVIKRNWLLATIIVILQLLLFSATGHKSYFFALPLSLILMWIITRRNPLAYMANGLFGIVLLGMLAYWLTDNLFISSLFTRRVLLVPAQLSFLYYDFFSNHELVYLSFSRLGIFSDYPYDLPPPNLIAQVYLANPATNANTGITADAYMNFGFIGMALYSILLFIIFKLLDVCSKGVDLRLGVAAIGMAAIGMTNGALTTVLLTGGLFLTILLLYLLPKEKSGQVA